MRNIFTLLLITFCLQSFGQGLWYRDNDRDGFGDPNFPATGPIIPPGFVADNTDCDDFNFNVNPDVIWYKDADSDGYTDGTIVKACYQPVGYVKIARFPQLDCFDNDPKLNYSTWYRDRDGDGYIPVDGYVDIRVTCENLSAEGYTLDIFVKGEDCNDYDATIYTVFSYLDNDGDGFPATNVPRKTCGGVPSPPYYLASQLNALAVDCDDSDPTNIPTTLWFEDQDGDGYTSGRSIKSCEKPDGYILEPFREDGNLMIDCNDNNAVEKPNQTWYGDNDGDGYGRGIFEGTILQSCTRPPGNWFAESELKAIGDCNDNDALINPETQWVKDGDGDGYYSGALIAQCASPGTGYVVATTLILPGDCDDMNKDINPSTLWYLDADGDGYSNNLFIPVPGGSCTPPQDGRNYIYNPKGSDCADDDATYNPETVWVMDADGDGYYFGEPYIGCFLIFQPGYVRKTNQQPGDCDDNNSAINVATFWLLDEDGDGYHNRLYFAQSPSCTAPQDGRNYTNNSKGQDCDDNDATNNPETVWVIDVDGDGYYVGEPFTGCFFISQPGYVRKTNQQPGDCDDQNPSVNPGAVESCSNGIDDNCNGSIDEKECEKCKNATDLRTTNISANSATLEWSSSTNPEEWLIQYKTTKKGTSWVNVSATGNKRSLTLNGLQANQNYAWRIQAQCDKKLTKHTKEVEFKTTGIGSTVEARKYEIVESPNFEVITAPNPSDNYFTLTVKSSNTTDRILVRVMDELGRVVEQKENVMSGTTIRFGDRYVPGMYFILVQQGKNSKAVKLIRR